jgi:hypothetical protein
MMWNSVDFTTHKIIKSGLEAFSKSKYVSQCLLLLWYSQVPPEELPLDQIKAAPDKPELNVLLWGKQKVKSLHCEALNLPPKYLTRYHDHPMFGSRFQKWFADAQATQYLNAKPVANAGGRGDGGEPAVKKPKTDNVDNLKTDQPQAAIKCIEIPNADLPSPLLHRVVLTTVKVGLAKIVTASGHVIYTSNESDKPISMCVGELYAGFYKGKWTQHKGADEDIPTNAVQFFLEDATNLVHTNGQLITVGALIDRKRNALAADTTVKYHTKVDSPQPGDPGHFLLKQEHKVLFTLADVPTTTTDDDEKGVPQA